MLPVNAVWLSNDEANHRFAFRGLPWPFGRSGRVRFTTSLSNTAHSMSYWGDVLGLRALEAELLLARAHDHDST